MGIKNWIYKKFGNPYNRKGYTITLREKRLRMFEEAFANTFRENLKAGQTIKILDIGGVSEYWTTLNFKYIKQVEITLVNLSEQPVPSEIRNIRSFISDARYLQAIADKEYHLAYSNSCIEHVGDKTDWEKMSNEMKRVSEHYYLQTPNFWFPIEAHFLVPFIHFMPLPIRALVVRLFQLGNMPRGKNWKDSLEIADSIHLLKYGNLRRLFPDADIRREKVFGLTKSFMVYGNMSPDSHNNFDSNINNSL